MIVDVGRGTGSGQRPELEEAVVDDVEGLGFVAEVVFAARFSGWPVLGSAILWRIGIGAGSVGAGVVDVGGLGIAPGGEAAVLPANVRVTGAAFFALFSSRARALGSRLGASRGLRDTFQM